ncbi:uncharacterized protein ACA1_155290 [Acanthamoeba castellanii str. Neff]|uniref:Uncharacterized protein n=1 Tax=Acanthamoeba castellanii (strain ATCC 30010 / Neff) TaxID=1257118 RepID=L8H060_ACACF|nr:uncharacterized protein ACA1_155290 [Acanthamoeba castellanii str. Neff]ELR18582.1 hypothetical protein ACA1_155290 [Acanthamoeba castellanii str. Neff]
MAASDTLSFVLLSAFLICAFVPYASTTSVNITRPAYVAFRDVNTCMQAAIAIVKNTDCNPQVSCSSDRTIYLTSCSTTNYELLGFNATYYLDYQYNTNYVAQGLSIYYSSTQLLWTFATSDDLLNFYSAAIYNSTWVPLPCDDHPHQRQFLHVHHLDAPPLRQLQVRNRHRLQLSLRS